MGELIEQLGKHSGPGGDSRPSEEDLQQEIVAPGEEALLPLGIVYSADWKTYGDGMAKHARSQVKALAMSGLPIHLQGIGTKMQLRDELHEDVLGVEYLENVTFSNTAITIRQLVMHTPESLLAQVLPRSVRSAGQEYTDRVCRSTIVYTSWERDRAHPQYIEILSRIGQLWVPCHANKKAFVSSGVAEDRVKVVPYPYDPAEHTIAFPRGSEIMPSHKRFYHIGKWEPRKNQHKMIGAFLTAFDPRKDKVSFLIKTSSFRSSNVPDNWADYPNVGI